MCPSQQLTENSGRRALGTRPLTLRAFFSSFELPSSVSLHEDAVSVLEVLWLGYGVKLAGVREEDAEGLVQRY